MINIWEWAYKDNIRITTVDGQVYDGSVIDITDVEETYGDPEDSITLEQKSGRIIGFYPSEIKSIENI